MTNIKELLKQQQESVKNDAFENTIAISKYNSEKMLEITNTVEAVIGKNMWNEFSFGHVSGFVLGLLRTLNFEYKSRNELCSKLGINPVYVDLYYQHSGNAPYYSKSGEIVPERRMDINLTRQLVKRVASELEIIVSSDDIKMINEENEKSRNESALQKARDTKENGSFTQNVNVNVNQNNEKYMQSLLDG